jgi:hypothetical protein
MNKLTIEKVKEILKNTSQFKNEDYGLSAIINDYNVYFNDCSGLFNITKSGVPVAQRITYEKMMEITKEK